MQASTAIRDNSGPVQGVLRVRPLRIGIHFGACPPALDQAKRPLSQAARASLKDQSRPETPRNNHHGRHRGEPGSAGDRPPSAIRRPASEKGNFREADGHHDPSSRMEEAAKRLAEASTPEEAEGALQAAKELLEGRSAQEIASERGSQPLAAQIERCLAHLLESSRWSLALGAVVALLRIHPIGSGTERELSAVKGAHLSSRQSGNDRLVREMGLLELLLPCFEGGATPACVHAAMALKNFSADKGSARMLAKRCNACEPLSVAFARAQRHDAPEEVIRVAEEGAAVVRNLVLDAKGLEECIAKRLHAFLAECMLAHPDRERISCNGCRALSKFTVWEEGAGALGSERPLAALLDALDRHATSHLLLSSRAAYGISNALVHSPSGREAFSGKIGGCARLGKSAYRLATAWREDKENGGHSRSALADALMRAIRGLGNLCLNASAGRELAQNREAVGSVAIALVEAEMASEEEELLLNAAWACANLSFFSREGQGVAERRFELVEGAADLLLSRNEEAVEEGARAVGNITSSWDDVAGAVLFRPCAECLVLLLDHPSLGVVHHAAGCLVNLARHPQAAEPLLRLQCLDSLAACLARLADVAEAGREDAFRAANVACKAGLNCLASFGSEQDADSASLVEAARDASNVGQRAAKEPTTWSQESRAEAAELDRTAGSLLSACKRAGPSRSDLEELC